MAKKRKARMKIDSKAFFKVINRITSNKSVTASVRFGASGDRSAGQNRVIVRTQARRNRNITDLSRAEEKRGVELWKVGIRGAKKTKRAIRKAGLKVAQYMVQRWRRHIDQSINIAPLAKSTVRNRLRQGFPAGPPLKRTGSLWRSFTGKASRAR